MSKPLKIGLFVLIPLLILAVIGKKAGWFGKEVVVKVAAEMVEKRNIVEIITANGKIQPETEVKLSPDVSGEIVELHVVEGDEVVAGQLLLKIKPDIYQSALERMTATLNSTKSNLENSKARLTQTEAQFTATELSYKRSKKLWEEGAISQADYETALSQYEMAKADVEAARQSVNAAMYSVKSSEASLKEAQENLTKTTIYAPMIGTVSMLNVEKGERVVGTAQMAGTELLRIANLDKMEVLVSVNENDIVRVEYGDTAVIEVDAYMDKKFKGVVTEIANSANVTGMGSDQVTNFDVKVLILRESYEDLIPDDNPDYYPFRPGMSATVNIQTKTVYDVLSVPIQSVSIRIDSTKTKMQNRESKEGESEFVVDGEEEEAINMDEMVEVVFIVEDGVVKMKYVETGIQDNTFIEITKGVSENDEVVVAPYSAISKKLEEGMKVEIVPREKLFSGNE